MRPTTDATTSPAHHRSGVGAELRIGGCCAIVGALVFGTARLLHGDTPADDATASLDFMAMRPQYAAVHLAAVFGGVLGVAGLAALARSIREPAARMWASLGLLAATVGLGVFGVESTSEGLALPELARAAATAPADQRAELVRAAHAVLAGTHGPSLVAIALIFGLGLLALGVAVVLARHLSTALGAVAVVIGAVTLVAAGGQYLDPDLVPGALIYGVLASVVAQLWILAVGVTLLRAARSEP